MQDNRNLTIGVLTITAVILLVGILLASNSTSHQAMAIGQIDRGGDYIIVTGQFTLNTELVYVVDAATRRMCAYSYDTTRRRIALWNQQDLKRIFGEVSP